jgi:ATP-binding cassette subfamily B multidrug efflux pump
VGDLITLARIVVAMVVFSPQALGLTFVAVPPLLLARRVPPARAPGLPRHPRQDRPDERLPQRAGDRRRGGAGLRPGGALPGRVPARSTQAYRAANLLAIRYDAMLYAVVEAFASVCIASLLFAGAHAVGAGAPAASLGVLVAFVQYIQRFFEPLRDLSGEVHHPAERDGRGRAGVRPCSTPPSPTPRRATPCRDARVEGAPAVQFDQVTFGYSPDRPTLRG